MTTLLFLAVFSLAIGSRIDSLVGGVPFMEFLAPGLIMMAIAQNALYGFIGYSDAAPLLGVAVMPFLRHYVCTHFIYYGAQNMRHLGLADVAQVW